LRAAVARNDGRRLLFLVNLTGKNERVCRFRMVMGERAAFYEGE
jgi:hypothetical protein